jgi:DNA-3-methyladenine glycosylase
MDYDRVMRRILLPSFFRRNALEVAPALLGKYLVRCIDGKEVAMMITEVEAYDGEMDLACHASRGKTPRTSVMYGPAGTGYVYIVYGMHFMLNVVTDAIDYPAAVLIRSTREVKGPARLTAALKIDRTLNNVVLGRENGLWIEDRGVVVRQSGIHRTPRIGIAYAGAWAKKPYRFLLAEERDGQHRLRVR